MDIKEIIKILPTTEKILVNYSDHNHELKYIVTENIRTGDGCLYKIVKGKLKKIFRKYFGGKCVILISDKRK